MAIIQWSNFFSVGVDIIDEQHKKLIEILNELYDGIQDNNGEEAIKDAIPKLVQYTKEHFVTEEKFMLDIGYPDFDKHFQRHYKFAEEAGNFKAMLERGEHINYLELTVLVSDWLKDHILDEDRDYGLYAIENKSHALSE